MFLIIPLVRKSIFSRFFHMRYIESGERKWWPFTWIQNFAYPWRMPRLYKRNVNHSEVICWSARCHSETTRTSGFKGCHFNGQRSVVQLPRFNGYFFDVTDRRTVKQFRGDHGQAPSIHKFYTYLVATYKFYAPQWWHIASSTLTLSKVLYLFVPFIVIQLCNKNQQNTNFLR